MVQKYQNEIPPIFYYGISTKISEKDLKIPNLQALTLSRIIKITLYEIGGFWSKKFQTNFSIFTLTFLAIFHHPYFVDYIS